MKPESQNTWTRSPSSRNSRDCSGARSTLLEKTCRVRWRRIDADAAIAQREHEAGADDAEHDAHEVAEIDDDEHHGERQRRVRPGALRRRGRKLDQDHGAEISQHAAENCLRHDRADIGTGKQNDGADDAHDGARPARRWRRIRQARGAVHRQRAGEPAQRPRQADWRSRWCGTPCRDRRIFCRATSRPDDVEQQRDGR